MLVANPPYSVKGFLETLSMEERGKYELISEINDLSKNNSIETFFIERAKQLLSPGGVAAIILPSSVLSNGNIYIKCREIILKYFDIISIVEMGSGTFGKTGTNTVTLFLRRKSENPALAIHYKYRVDAWFNGNTIHDERYDDCELLEKYCEYIGVSKKDYETLFVSSPNEELLETNLFKEYFDKFVDDTRAKKIRKKRISAKYTEEMRKAELHTYIINSIKEIEKDKLYFFLLAMSNPQPVVIVKSPSKTSEIKKFLGYEWSSSKGNEGIKYIGTRDINDENELERNKGVSKIKTPLFDPLNLHNEEKINMLIRHNFLGEDLNVAEEYEEYVSINNLVDLINFSHIDFDKVIKTSVQRVFEFSSKFDLVSIKSIYNQIESGTRPAGGVGYIINGAFSLGGEHIDNTNGHLSLSDPKYVPIDFYREAQKGIIQKHDILICKDGALTGKVALVRDELNGKYAMINEHIFLLRNKNLVLQTYMFNLLLSNIGQSLLKANITGSAQGGLNSTNLKNIKIPLPPKKIQEDIVRECNIIDDEYENAIIQINNFRQKITDIIQPIFNKYEYKKLDTLCSSFEYGTSSKSSPIGKVAVIRMGNVQNGKIVWDNVVYSNDSDDIEQYMLHENDVLFNRTNSPIHVGKSAIFTGDRPAIFAGYLIRVNYKKELLNPKYLTYILNSKPIREHGFSVMSKSINQANISAGLLKQYEIPLPPMEHQKEIVAQIENCELEIHKAQIIIDSYSDKRNTILDKYLK